LFGEKILAVIGGAVLGALVAGLLAQLVTRAMTMQKMPRWSIIVIRLLGGVIGGWLVAWVLGFGGGSGYGGSGGWWPGSGQGQGPDAKEVAKKEGDNGKHKGDGETPRDETMRIEVLGSAALPEGYSSKQRLYRLDQGPEAELLNFADVRDAIKKRQAQQPPLRRIEIVLYKDSPEEHLPVVAILQAWCSALEAGKMKVDIQKRSGDAPRK